MLFCYLLQGCCISSCLYPNALPPDLCLDVPFLTFRSQFKFFVPQNSSTTTQLKVACSHSLTPSYFNPLQSSDYSLKLLSGLNICLFAITIHCHHENRELLYLVHSSVSGYLLSNKVCCRIEWMSNEWMSSREINMKRDDYHIGRCWKIDENKIL
jgi:hypothetical protein